jgi:hypothetical protein
MSTKFSSGGIGESSTDLAMLSTSFRITYQFITATSGPKHRRG